MTDTERRRDRVECRGGDGGRERKGGIVDTKVESSEDRGTKEVDERVRNREEKESGREREKIAIELLLQRTID